MAKRHSPGQLDRLAGKKIVFSGKFDYGVEKQLQALAEAQGGSVADELDAAADYLVLPDLASGKTAQKKALSLNGKGASIQVVDADDFLKLVELTDEEALHLLRTGQAEQFNRAHLRLFSQARNQPPKRLFQAENLEGAELRGARLIDVHFRGCSFVGAKLHNVYFNTAAECDFSRVVAESSQFENAAQSRFCQAQLKHGGFRGDFSGVDFTGATLEGVSFSELYTHRRSKQPIASATFAQARVLGSTFAGLSLKAGHFDGADLSGSGFHECQLEAATFRKARLAGAALVRCQAAGADFREADLTGANLAGSDLTGANFQGANLLRANLRGAKLDGADFRQAQNYDPSAAATGAAGPALQELDALAASARRIQATFLVQGKPDEPGHAVGIDSATLKYGWGLMVHVPGAQPARHQRQRTFSGAMLELASLVGHLQVRFETLEVSSTKSAKGGKELRELVLRGITEAFAQEPPAADELAAAAKAHRDAARQQGAAERERRAQAKAEAEQQKARQQRQLTKQIEKAVGKVSDVASFLKAVELRIEKAKLHKATSMLKASGFKLFNDVTKTRVSGVVKSQTDADLVYACSLGSDGQYACCTQNLNVCGGLRGSLCKHLLVLIIGLVQAGELDPTTVDGWIAQSHGVKPELDKEQMGAIFIKYKGAEAGEVDWRPTETAPEDYYAL